MGLIGFATRHGIVHLIEENDRCVAHERDGGFELETREVWEGLVGPGKTVMDVGAYTGIYSLIAALAGAKAIAVEPYAPVIRRMSENMQVNGAMSIEQHFCACADTVGTAVLYYNPLVPLTSGASIVRPGIGSSVSLSTVDAIASNRKIDAIKIDVEGAEELVLAGAANVVQHHRPVLIIETLSAAARASVTRLLPSYELAQVADGRNCVFLPKGEG